MESSVEAKSRQVSQPGFLTGTQEDYTSERDDALLFYMAGRDDDLAVAEGACAEFYRRHFQFVVAFCRQRRWETEEHPVEQFADAIFQKAWKHAARFRCASTLTTDQVRRKVRAWLLTISKHTLIDILRGDPEGDTESLDQLLSEEGWPVPLSLRYEPSEPDELAAVTPRRKTLVWKFLNQTDRRTRVILLAMGDHWSPSSEQCKFPPEVREALCSELEIGKDSLRTYCKRALKALENYINENE